jgi:hypothetical protein
MGVTAAAVLGGALLIDEPSIKQEGTFVIAFDTDRGTADVQSHYTEWAHPIIEGCAPYRARIYALPITSDTATSQVSPVDQRLADIRGLGGSPARDRERLAAATTAIVSRVTAMIAKAAQLSGYSGTDGTVALSVARPPAGHQATIDGRAE